MTQRSLGVLALALALVAPRLTVAFVVDVSHWYQGTAPLHAGLLASPLRGALTGAAADWTAASGFRFAVDAQATGACSGRTLQNGAHLSAVDCSGTPLGPNTLALTEWTFIGDATIDAGTTFNAGVDWAVYDGPWRVARPDFRRVALHELGHVLGLGHEDDVPAIMSTFVDDDDRLRADDVAGAVQLYGPPTTSAPDTSPRCRIRQLKAGRALCASALGCEAARLRKPATDPQGTARDACLVGARRRFVSRWDGAVARAADDGIPCLMTEAGGVAQASITDATATLAQAIAGGGAPQTGAGAPQTGGDAEGGRAARRLRARLVRHAKTMCRQALGAERTFARTADAIRRDDGRAAARARLLAVADRAIGRAARKGVAYDGASPAATADSVDALVDDLADAVAGHP